MPRTAPIAVLLVLAACEPDPQLPDCVDLAFEIDTCGPLYQPTFDNVYDSSMHNRCDSAGGACHAKDGASGTKNGLVLSDADTAHAALMGESHGRPFVDVEDPACSVLLVRLAVDDEDFRMPPGEFARPDNKLCSIAKWMAAGAER